MSEQGQPGRYNRSVNGLVASMVVIVLMVLAFVWVRALVSNQVDTAVQPPIDYIGTVRDLQGTGFYPVYPAALPTGWTAFDVDYTVGTPPVWGLQLHTAEQHYIGIQESSSDAGALLDTYVDANAASAPGLTTPGGLAPAWAGWSDKGGDHAFTAKVGTQTVIVFGSASVGDIETVVRSLTVAKLSDATTTPATPATAGPSTGPTTGPTS